METMLKKAGRFAAIAGSGTALLIATVPATAAIDAPECNAQWLSVTAEAHGGSLEIALGTKLGRLRVRFG